MSKEIYISSTPHETRLAIVEKDELTEIYYERENEYTLAGSIYNGRVTRVLPGMQSSFVDIGLERDAFLYITDFMEEQGDSADFESSENGSRGRRGSRSRQAEGSDAGAPETDSGDRSEGRGDRDRRRGRRSESPRPPRTEGNGETVVLTSEGDDFASEPHHAEAEGETIGEGAPGADGSRRWRGRRGRRRGRGNGEESAASSAAPSAGVQAQDAAERPEAEPQQERGRERHEGRGDRGRREERSNRHDAVRERFAPRGARPSYGDEGGSVEITASAEPFILPGESLSKYRKGGEAQEPTASHAIATPKQSFITPKISTEAPPIAGWDGGLTLPGESLSRHRGARGGETGNGIAVDNAGSDDRSAENQGRDRRRQRDERRSRFEPRAELSPVEAVLPAVTSQHEPEALPLTDDAPEFLTEATEERLHVEHELAADGDYTAETDVAPAKTEEPSETLLEVVEEFHETVAEYEPGEEASASYRVDPSGPSEFRQSAPVEEFGSDLAEPRFEERGVLSESAAEHEFTTLQASGEMISEEPLTAEAEAAPIDAEQPASPIEHEGAVQSVTLHEAETTPVPAERAPHEFYPGEGELEEELLDDEDGEAFALHGSAIDEEMEEETLEGAADLGSMLEDLSIDQITAPEDLDEDEYSDEDMEEDELESDDEFAASDISEAEEEQALEADEFDEDAATEEVSAEPIAGEEPVRREREGGRDDERRGRRGGRDRGGRDRGGRDRRGMANSRGNGRSGRPSMQSTNLPAISDLLKPGQEVLVQIAKEPIAKKGARITSHIALPGRFLVFMPTVNHVGVSRKIESDSERRRLKEILLSEKGDASGGFIVRTAASGASEDELRSDLRFLLHLWADIKQRSESSKSPALIYHDLNLVERILRDQVTDNFSAIWVDTESEYERVLRFLQRFQPSLIRRVKLYTKDTPLFEQFGISEEINKALRSKVWLKSGGSIVINQTEALVAIDINTGKYVGKTARLEDTIVKTNLDAIPEIVRQIRLRDLGGIIIIDFIDMDERKNRHKVMAALEEELKKDRAPSKVLQFNDFGLVAITRKRVKQSLERTLSTTCNICTGTGMVKSPVTVCNEIFIELRKMHRQLEKADIMLRVNPEVVKQLKTSSGKWLQEMEEMTGKTILVKSDPGLHPEQFDIH
jgi:ribonuclease E